MQRVIALGFPKTPSGASKTTFFADSGAPGLDSEKDVVKSGCPPAWELDIVVENDSIATSAVAGAASASSAPLVAAMVAMNLVALIAHSFGGGVSRAGESASSHTCRAA